MVKSPFLSVKIDWPAQLFQGHLFSDSVLQLFCTQLNFELFISCNHPQCIKTKPNSSRFCIPFKADAFLTSAMSNHELNTVLMNFLRLGNFLMVFIPGVLKNNQPVHAVLADPES